MAVSSTVESGIPAADFARITYLPEGSMRRLPVALVPAAVGLLLAACVADRDTTSPRVAAPDSPSLTVTPTTPACNSLLRTDAQAYFKFNSDPVFDDITALATAYGAAPSTHPDLATPFGLKIFAHISAARKDPGRLKSGTTSAKAGTLAHDVAACMNLGPLDATFAGTAIGTGIFDVRGLATDPQVATLAYPEAFPRWGVESKTAAWPTSTAFPRYLILGVPGAPASELGGEPASVASFVGYDVASLPANLPKGGLRVGICIKTTTSDLNAVNRLIHAGVVEPNSPPTFCAGAPLASLSRSAWFASVASRITSVFSPTTLFAQDDSRDLLSFTGGGPSSWSPQAFGKIIGANIGLGFAKQPKNGFIAPAVLDTFIVHTGTATHSILGTVVTIEVFSNNGTPAGAFVTGATRLATDSNGDAIFTAVKVNKAGGYYLTATATYGGVPTGTAISTKFQIKNKDAP